VTGFLAAGARGGLALRAQRIEIVDEQHGRARGAGREEH